MAKQKPPAPDPQLEEGEEGDEQPAKLELTEQELQDRIEAATVAAVKADRDEQKKKAREKKKQLAREEAEEDEEEQEDPKEIIANAETRAAEAEQRAAEAEKKALMADVNVRLRDYLTANFKEFVGNAPDIILHIERALSENAKEQEIIRLIEAQSKAFVERTKSARAASTNAINANRSKLIGGGQQGQQQEQRESRNISGRREDQPQPRFAAINWHG